MPRLRTITLAAMVGAAAAVPAYAQQQAQQRQTQPSQSQEMGRSGKAAQLSQDEIRQIQTELKQMGLYKGQADGKVGPETRQAVSQFQQQNGMQQSATLDEQTVDRIMGKGSSATGASTGDAGSTKQGTQGPTGSTQGSDTQPSPERSPDSRPGTGASPPGQSQ